MKETAVGLFTAESEIVRILTWKVGATSSVDCTIAVAVMSVAEANTAAAVLLVASAACVDVAVVTPVATVSVHDTCAFKVAAAAWNVKKAVACDELVPVTENVVLPHPDLLGVANVPKVKLGTTTFTMSPDSILVFEMNVNVIADAAAVTGFERTREVCVK